MQDPPRIRLHQGDITTFAVDAIVNAADESLSGGGGVDGAIHRAAGPGLLAECRKVAPCPTGEARLTGGYQLPARHVIHTVGPVYQGGGALESYYLACCYRNCLLLALAHGLRTLAFPAISCGVYGYPAREAARIAVGNIAGFIADEPRIESVDLVCFNASTYYAYEDAWNALLGRG